MLCFLGCSPKGKGHGSKCPGSPTSPGPLQVCGGWGEWQIFQALHTRTRAHTLQLGFCVDRKAALSAYPWGSWDPLGQLGEAGMVLPPPPSLHSSDVGSEAQRDSGIPPLPQGTTWARLECFLSGTLSQEALPGVRLSGPGAASDSVGFPHHSHTRRLHNGGFSARLAPSLPGLYLPATRITGDPPCPELPGTGHGVPCVCPRPSAAPSAPQRGSWLLPLPSREHLPPPVIKGSAPGVAGTAARNPGGEPLPAPSATSSAKRGSGCRV